MKMIIRAWLDGVWSALYSVIYFVMNWENPTSFYTVVTPSMIEKLAELARKSDEPPTREQAAIFVIKYLKSVDLK